MSKLVTLEKEQRVFKSSRQGKSRANPMLIMYVHKNGRDYNRIGISVNKKWARAL